MEHGKVPPQAVDLEEAVLGACMLGAGAYDSIAHVLEPDCFYKEAHQLLFKAISHLASKNEPIDIMTVTGRMKETGELDIVGGPYYITQLTNRVASAANLEYHSYIVYQQFVKREMIRLCSDLVKQSYEDTLDFDMMGSLYSGHTEHLDNLLAGRRADKNMQQVMKDHMTELDRRVQLSQEDKMTGIPTGLVDLNKITNGWQPGDLIIVAGRPGMGKTAVALNLFAKHAATEDKKVLFYSLEMSDISLADRLVCSCGGIHPDNLKSGRLTPDEMERYHQNVKELIDLPFYIDDSARVGLKHITAISRAKKRKGLCDLIVIDYLQLIESPQEAYSFKNREREVADLSRGLKLLAKELKVPVILLCQLSRAVESRNVKRPQLSDLRESGAIEQDADIVLFPFRPEYYGDEVDDEGTSTKGVMVLVNAKNRNGSLRDVYAKYSEDLTRFYDYYEGTEPF